MPTSACIVHSIATIVTELASEYQVRAVWADGAAASLRNNVVAAVWSRAQDAGAAAGATHRAAVDDPRAQRATQHGFTHRLLTVTQHWHQRTCIIIVQ